MPLRLQIKVITYSTQVDNFSHGCTSHSVFMGSTSERLNMILMAVVKEVRALKERNKGKSTSGIEANHRYTHLGPGQRQKPCPLVCCPHVLPFKGDAGHDFPHLYSKLFKQLHIWNSQVIKVRKS